MSWQPSIGASLRDDGVFFRVWAPDRQQVDVAIYEGDRPSTLHPLTREEDGYWSGLVAGAGAGAHYMYRLDDDRDRPDPASRHQPLGVHGPSMVVDAAFAWTDEGWNGVPREEMIVYELHVGTATEAGTFDALIERLPDLRELGITAIEIMPVADFPGDRNWGYDGVDLYAPARAYGGVEGLKRLVDAAHAAGLAVILDVVYNHLGPSGNYLREYARDYFTDRHHTPWGEALNFDGPGSQAVRDFFVENALSWVHEYHIDGLRLDAIHAIIDDSPEHVLQELVRRVHASLPAERLVAIIAEDPRNEARLARPLSEEGYGLDAIWADDFHHVVRVTLTGEQEGYYAAYRGGAEELAATLRGGWLFQGQPDPHTGEPRGTPAPDLPPSSFVYCIQNHDQIGNRAFGERLNHDVSPAAYRAASALLLLAPPMPLLFMGQEWAASSPFLFFTDHDPDLGRLVTEGRRKEFAKFTAFQGAEVPDPQAIETFQRSRLRWDERTAPAHAPILRLYQDLLALRRQEPALRTPRRDQLMVQVTGDQSVALLLKGAAQDEPTILLLANLGQRAAVDLNDFTNAGSWELILDTEASIYGGAHDTALGHGRIEIAGPRALVFRGGSQGAGR
jgi:maltooligosyltrehalose trehalohydrolase